MFTKKFAAALTVLLATSGAQALPLITNGSFEDVGSATTQSWGGYTYGVGTSMPGWTVDKGNVDIVTPAYTLLHGASAGDNFLDLNGYTAGSIHQSFTTVVGQSYLLNFDYALNGNDLDTSALVKIAPIASGLNSAILEFTIAPSQNPIGWKGFSSVFVATTSATTLSFKALSAGNAGILLDRVSVSAVPEPTTTALLLAGLGAIGFAAKRRKSA